MTELRKKKRTKMDRKPRQKSIQGKRVNEISGRGNKWKEKERIIEE